MRADEALTQSALRGKVACGGAAHGLLDLAAFVGALGEVRVYEHAAFARGVGDIAPQRFAARQDEAWRQRNANAPARHAVEAVGQRQRSVHRRA